MPTRRHFLIGFVATPIVLPRLGHATGTPAQLSLTPTCDDDDDLTPAQTEGPYFTPESPEKQDFASDAPGGEKMTLAGYVLTEDCQPVAKALIELWHANESGTYDNSGYKLRGHQFTDGEGRWWFETTVPGLYSGRTRHFHLKVQRPGGSVLTTQLYFPGEPLNERDRIFNASLLLDVRATSDGKFGRYDFVWRSRGAYHPCSLLLHLAPPRTRARDTQPAVTKLVDFRADPTFSIHPHNLA